MLIYSAFFLLGDDEDIKLAARELSTPSANVNKRTTLFNSDVSFSAKYYINITLS